MRGQLFTARPPWLLCRRLALGWLLLCCLAVSCGQSSSSSPASSNSPSSNPASYALAHIAYDYLVPPGSTPADILATSDAAPEAQLVSGSLADYAGRPLVINFWASWCAPCVTEMPEFERVYQSYQDRVAFLGINVQDEPADALDLAVVTGVTYPLALDPQADIQLGLRIISTPATLFISPSGEVLDTWQGILDEAELSSRIQGNFAIAYP